MENVYTLATDLLKFKQEYDTYEYYDDCSDSDFIELLNETVSNLLNDKSFHEVCKYLYEGFIDSDDSNTRYSAMNLLRRLESPWTI